MAEKSINERLSSNETADKFSLSFVETERTVQLLEDRQKIHSAFEKESKLAVNMINSSDSDAKRTKIETQDMLTSKELKTPGTFGRRPTTASRSSSKLRQPFKSPLQSRQQPVPTEEKTTLLEEIQSLEAKLEILNKDIKELSEEYSEEELQVHIDKLHEYNEIKDIGQLLIGKLAEMDGTTTRAMYQEFGLELED